MTASTRRQGEHNIISWQTQPPNVCSKD